MKLFILLDTSVFIVANSEEEAVVVARNRGYSDNDIEIAIREDITYDEEYGWCGNSTFKWNGWEWEYKYSRRFGCKEYSEEPFILYDYGTGTLHNY